jgi:hypothetical protein
MNAIRLRLALGLLDSKFRALESNAAVGAIAKRLVHRTTAAAERKSGFSSEVELVSVDIDEFDGTLGRLYAVGAIGTDCDLYLSHDFDSSNLTDF